VRYSEAWPHVDSGSCRMGLLHFLTGWSKTPLNKVLVVLGLVSVFACSLLQWLFRLLCCSLPLALVWLHVA